MIQSLLIERLIRSESRESFFRFALTLFMVKMKLNQANAKRAPHEREQATWYVRNPSTRSGMYEINPQAMCG